MKKLSRFPLLLVGTCLLLLVTGCGKYSSPSGGYQQPIPTGGGNAPTVSGFSPASGPVGTQITVTGTNLTGTYISGGYTYTYPTTAAVNGYAATTSNLSATSVKVTVPAGATTGKVTVTVNGATGTSTADFTVQ